MYRFEAMNGCSICNAMEGLYDEEPVRPHDYCRCVISLVDDEDTALTRPTSGRPGSPGRTGDGWSWSWDDSENSEIGIDEDGDGWGEKHRLKGTISVDCCDGKTVTGDDYEMVVVVREFDPAEEDGNEVWEAALQEAEVGLRKRARELTESDCDPCGEVS